MTTPVYRCAMLTTTAALWLCLSGCSRPDTDPGIADEMKAVTARQTALVERVAALEQENAALGAQLDQLSRRGAGRAAPGLTSPAAGATTNLIADERLDQLAQTIGATVTSRLLPDLEGVIDDRIAAQVGTAEDIEAFFVDAFDQQMEEREERARQAREAEARERRERSARSQIERMGEVVGIDEDQGARVMTAYLTRNQSTRDAVHELRAKGEYSMTTYRKIRDEAEAAYQAEIQGIMSPEQYEAYQTKWRGASRRRSRPRDE